MTSLFKKPYAIVIMLILITGMASMAKSYIEKKREQFIDLGRLEERALWQDEIAIQTQHQYDWNIENQAKLKKQYARQVENANRRAEATADKLIELQQEIEDAETIGESTGCDSLGPDYLRVRKQTQCTLNTATGNGNMPSAGCEPSG
tara:strand:+ start:1928 stop:2371 length:444 start_codon:yes stop_codon:yes gene_type:complete